MDQRLHFSTITVSGDGVKVSGGSAIPEPASVSGPENEVYTITVKNTPGVVLPITGGPRTTAYTTLGSLIILAATVLLLKKRRENHN